MAEGEIHKGDIGTTFLIIVEEDGAPADLSSATLANLIFKDPIGRKITRPLSKVTTGADGQFYYMTVEGDLGMDGTWKSQAFVQTNIGSWSTEVVEFEVFPNL